MPENIDLLGNVRTTRDALDKAWEEASAQYHATITAGNADPELAWESYVLGQLRSAYDLYADLHLLRKTK